MIIDAYLGISDFISMHIIILICIFLSFHEKVSIISKHFKLGLSMMI